MLGLLAVLALAEPAGAGVDAPEPTEDRGVSWFVIPVAAYDTDDGFGAGLRGELSFTDAEHTPYRQSFVMHLYASLTGYHHHRLRWDRLGLGPRGRLRLTVKLAWRQWLHDGYWGIGNGTAIDAAWYATDHDADDPERHRYQYSLFLPSAHVLARWDLQEDGPWQLFAAVEPKVAAVRTFDGSLLEEHRPYGMEGGPVVQVMGGALFDTRDPEIAPRRGVLLELSGRLAPRLSGEAGGFGGVLASARGFAPVGPHVTLAGRVLGEWLLGDVPFYEMVHWGGALPISGFGGAETLRGISFGRWRAPGKALLNAEVRIIVLRHTVGGHPLWWEVAPFGDLGVVWDAGEAATADAPEVPVHPAAGIGLRPIYDELTVGRLDLAVGRDDLSDGSHVPSVGFYLTFEHMF